MQEIYKRMKQVSGFEEVPGVNPRPGYFWRPWEQSDLATVDFKSKFGTQPFQSKPDEEHKCSEEVKELVFCLQNNPSEIQVCQSQMDEVSK